MKVTTVPGSRFGWQGQTLEYVVKAAGASEVTANEKGADGLRVEDVLASRRDRVVEDFWRRLGRVLREGQDALALGQDFGASP